MSEWINVKDKLPEQQYQSYLIYPAPDFIYSDKLTAEFTPKGWLVWCEDSNLIWEEYVDVTHWMPLPEPPEINSRILYSLIR